MNRLPINLRRVAIMAGIAILILMVMDFNARLEGLERLKKDAAVVQAQATQVMQTQIALQTAVTYAASDRAVEDWARDTRRGQPGDHLVVPLAEPGSTAVAPVESTPAPTPMKNWQVWWQLFFDE